MDKGLFTQLSFIDPSRARNAIAECACCVTRSPSPTTDDGANYWFRDARSRLHWTCREKERIMITYRHKGFKCLERLQRNISRFARIKSCLHNEKHNKRRSLHFSRNPISLARFMIEGIMWSHLCDISLAALYRFPRIFRWLMPRARERRQFSSNWEMQYCKNVFSGISNDLLARIICNSIESTWGLLISLQDVTKLFVIFGSHQITE